MYSSPFLPTNLNLIICERVRARERISLQPAKSRRPCLAPYLAEVLGQQQTKAKVCAALRRGRVRLERREGERKFEVKSDLLVGQPVSHCSHKSVSQSLRSQPAGQSQRASQTKGIRGACHHHPFRHHHHHHLKRSLIHDACKYDLKAASNVTQVYASTISINQPAIDWTEVVISRHNMILGRTRYRCR